MWIWNCGAQKECLWIYVDLPPLPPSSVGALCHSCFHVKPREGLRSRVKPREGSCSHVQPREGFRSQDRPREGSCSHVQPREGSCSHVQPREGFRSQDRPREGPCFHVQPREGFRSRDRPREGPCSTSSPDRAPVPEFSPERAPVPTSSPKRAPVPTSSPERAPVSTSSPDSAPVPTSSPERAPVPEFNPERASVSPSPGRAFVLEYSPEKPGGSKMSTHRPAPASSTAVIWQPLCSHLYGASSAGLPVSIGAVAGGSPVSASSLRVQDSASVRRPSCSTMAPSSLCSAVSRQSTGSAGLPRPSGSALVCQRPSAAPQDSTPPATPRPAGSVRLLLPFGSASVTLAHRLSVSTSGSSATCSAAIGRPSGVVSPSSSMASPSVSSTVGHHYGCGLGPTWRRMLQVPPVSSMAPPLLSVVLLPGVILCPNLHLCCLPAFLPALSVLCYHPKSTSLSASKSPPSHPLFLRREVAPSRWGVNCHTPGLLCCVFSPCALRDPVSVSS